MEFRDTLEKQLLSDPQFVRALIDEIREVVAENERLRKAIEAIAETTNNALWRIEE